MESVFDGLVRVVEAADSGWAVLAIFLLGLYVLAWRYGGEALTLLRSTHDTAEHVATSIVTNHGSKNLGDAVDRLTVSIEANRLEVRGVNDKLDTHIADYNARNEENEPLLKLSRQLLLQRLQEQLKGGDDAE